MRKLLLVASLCSVFCFPSYALDVYQEADEEYGRVSGDGSLPMIEFVDYLKEKIKINQGLERQNKYISFFDITVMTGLRHGINKNATYEQSQRLLFYVNEVNRDVLFSDHIAPFVRALESLKSRGLMTADLIKDQTSAYIENLVVHIIYCELNSHGLASRSPSPESVDDDALVCDQQQDSPNLPSGDETSLVPQLPSSVEVVVRRIEEDQNVVIHLSEIPFEAELQLEDDDQKSHSASDDDELPVEDETNPESEDEKFERAMQELRELAPASEIFTLLGNLVTIPEESREAYLRELMEKIMWKYAIDPKIIERGNAIFDSLQRDRFSVLDLMRDCFGTDDRFSLSLEAKKAGRIYLTSKELLSREKIASIYRNATMSKNVFDRIKKDLPLAHENHDFLYLFYKNYNGFINTTDDSDEERYNELQKDFKKINDLFDAGIPVDNFSEFCTWRSNVQDTLAREGTDHVAVPITDQLDKAKKFISENEDLESFSSFNDFFQHYSPLVKGFIDSLQEKNPAIRTIVSPVYTSVDDVTVNRNFEGVDITLGLLPLDQGLDFGEFKGTYLLGEDFLIQSDSTTQVLRAFPIRDQSRLSWNGMGTILERYPEIFDQE